MRALASALAVASVSAALLASPAMAEPAKPDVPHEVFAPNGTIKRVEVDPDDLPKVSKSLVAAPSRLKEVEINGPSANRIDLVFLGDGYTAAQQTEYGTEIDAAWAEMVQREPYKSYRKLFNVWRIEIDSPQSGVSGDPTADVQVDSPLASTFWCGGTERLLCVDTVKSWEYARALVPGADQVLVQANSTKYGGAGYGGSDLGTFSRNPSSREVVLHELGHSQGDLADEYDYGGPDQYPGATEPGAANVTIDNTGGKWGVWLGEATPDGGVIGAFEGGSYSRLGIWRPSANSLMRNLGQDFGLVNREKLVQSFYTQTDPVDSASTPSGGTHNASQSLTLTTLDVPLAVKWQVDNVAVPAWDGKKTLTPADFATTGKTNFALKATVTDETAMVRNTIYKPELTQTLTWTVGQNTSTNPNAVFEKTSDWGTGFEANVTVTAGSTALTSWTVEFDVPAGYSILSTWDANRTRTNNHYTFTNKSYNGAVDPGESVVFGLGGVTGNFPGITNCKINGNPCS
ncbi:M64 family metallopeptidase [Spongiactinospora sp. TRM90649]|uniref:M64 family metallopeptidase n=1 Tax=Spongiactinospora sp. TRM90649 TaxID=3031114 RepID=UPI0023F6A69A|nr:M64 family metallopeptidase [Spongiactinospora sp. TRM90649]MDF5758883.1 M64 family metallopeptidase [Spongiactinospora sp. TRM90649]